MNNRYETITSRNNPLIKWVASLHDKKGRISAKSFIAEGEKLCFEGFDASLPVTHCFIASSKSELYLPRVSKIVENDKYSTLKIIVCDDSVFAKISTEKAPQGIIIVIKYLDFFSDMDIIYKEEFFLSEDERAIVLCSVRDPSNLGSVIRSSVAFGTEHLVLTDDCADLYNPKTVRSAMGSLFRVKATRVKSLASFIDAARQNGRRIFAAELSDGAIPLTEVDAKATDCFIIGNEGHGIPSEISSLCDRSVYIPISKKTESLNASVAAAVFMWEQNK